MLTALACPDLEIRNGHVTYEISCFRTKITISDFIRAFPKFFMVFENITKLGITKCLTLNEWLN